MKTQRSVELSPDFDPTDWSTWLVSPSNDWLASRFTYCCHTKYLRLDRILHNKQVKHFNSWIASPPSQSLLGVVHFMLNVQRVIDLFCSETASLELTVPEFVADVTSVFCPSSSRLQLEIWATVGVISSSCWQWFGGSAPSCLLTVERCSAKTKHTQLAVVLVHTEPSGKRKAQQ